jgi:predicted DNA binding protein
LRSSIGALTDRQREVLTVAYGMGSFEHPHEANAEAVAAALDVTPSTFAEHLAAAQSKLVDSILGRRA